MSLFLWHQGTLHVCRPTVLRSGQHARRVSHAGADKDLLNLLQQTSKWTVYEGKPQSNCLDIQCNCMCAYINVICICSEPALSPSTSFMSFVKGSNSAFNSSILGGSMYSLSYLLPPLNITNQIQSKG